MWETIKTRATLDYGITKYNFTSVDSYTYHKVVFKHPAPLQEFTIMPPCPRPFEIGNTFLRQTEFLVKKSSRALEFEWCTKVCRHTNGHRLCLRIFAEQFINQHDLLSDCKSSNKTFAIKVQNCVR